MSYREKSRKVEKEGDIEMEDKNNVGDLTE
jgi:hypothetical protein